MPYIVCEAVREDGQQLPVEDAVLFPEKVRTRPLRSYPTWSQALRAVARVEARARRQEPARDLTLVIVRLTPPPA
jgi:hypothetical protein